MSLTESPSPVARKPRKSKPRRKRASKPPSEFAGLTTNDCASGCSTAGCIISGKTYCAHPFKGGLQGGDVSNNAALSRVEAAKKMLGKAKVKLEKL